MDGTAATTRQCVLACRELRFSYGDRVAVDGVSFEIAPGESFGLLGPNGAGKSTTIKMICGLLPPASGEVAVAGHPMAGNAVLAKQSLGYVPQDLAIYPDLTALENMDFWGRLQGLRGRELAHRIEHSLGVVALAERRNDIVETFSGGMQRRLNLAVALLGNPDLLVLDEPTVGVDAQTRNAILDRLEELRVAGTAILYASHYMEEVERVCSVVGIIDRGKLMAHGTPKDLVSEFAGSQRLELETTGDLGCFLLDARKIAGISDVRVDGNSVWLSVERAASVMPQVVTVATASGVELSAIEIVRPNLEVVFLELTGRSLRD